MINVALYVQCIDGGTFMRSSSLIAAVSLAVGILHAAVVFHVSTDASTVEGSWRGFSLFFIDFPLSIAFLGASRDVLPWLHGVLGSAWWSGIAWIAMTGLKAILKRVSPK